MTEYHDILQRQQRVGIGEPDLQRASKTDKVSIAISSEEPVLRENGYEILDHSPGSIITSRLRKGVALLFNHDRNLNLGVIDNPRIGSDRILRGDARFAPNDLAQSKKADVLDGALPWVSVGYRVLETRKEGRDSYRATKWEVLEVSLVTVPADPTVGVGRAVAEPESRRVVMPEPETVSEMELERLRLRVALARRID